MSPTETDAIVREFLVESRENIDQFERALVHLEQHPTARESLDTAFRAIHSIKGAAGLLGLANLGAVSHAGESLLSRLREGRLTIGADIAGALLSLVDRARTIVSSIERTGAEGPGSDEDDVDCAALIERLEQFQKPQADAQVAASQPLVPEIKDVKDVKDAASAAGSIRVDVTHLDSLMNLVGELVLARNEMFQHGGLRQDAALLSTGQRLSAITTQLQESTMKIRMQPISTVWTRLPRIVRDASFQCRKSVRLELEGKETELDKTLIEAINDPLLHLLRNAIDHGIETPERRAAAGKPEEGRLTLRAFHSEGQVNIEVADDGAGIDAASLRAKALERRLIGADQAAAMTDQDALNLIFLPGFSTARQVTSLSGRGVGMDVVKTNIEKIGGKVTVQSQIGAGTTIKIRIPLTLAIMPALLVTVRGDCYAIPQANVVELVRLEADTIDQAVERMKDAAVYRLRGSLIPLISLGHELWADSPIATAPRSAANIVVLQADDRRFGVLVDQINDTQEIVVKPLGRHLQAISLFAGATIMGDGRAALIVDVAGLALHSRVLSELRGTALAAAEPPAVDTSEPLESLLMFVGSDDGRMAVPLSGIARLEEFDPASLERLGGQTVVQYLDEALPLVRVSDLLPERRKERRPAAGEGDSSGTVQTIIYSKNGTRVGLVVDRLLDTVEHSLENLRPATRPGVRGTTIIQGRVAEVLDLDAICAPLLHATPPGAELAEAGA